MSLNYFVEGKAASAATELSGLNWLGSVREGHHLNPTHEVGVISSAWGSPLPKSRRLYQPLANCQHHRSGAVASPKLLHCLCYMPLNGAVREVQFKAVSFAAFDRLMQCSPHKRQRSILSDREKEILMWTAEGKSAWEIISLHRSA
jgi:hypothetical protein